MESTGREIFPDLRKRAEEKLESSKIESIQDEEVRKLVHELRVHKIELEMQNAELQKANEELKEARAQLEIDYINLYDFAPVGYCTFDKDGKIVMANLTLADLLNVSRGELIDISFYEYIHRADKDIFYLYLREIYEKTSKKSCEIRLIKEDNSVFYVQLEGVLQLTSGNCRTAITDITERKKAEEALKDSEQAWRDSFNSLKDIMMIIDRDLTVENINQNGLDLLGLPRREVIGKKCYELIHGDERPADCPFLKTLKSRQVESAECYSPEFDKFFSIKSSPVFDENGEIIKFVDLMRDITELKRTEQKLKKANEAKNIFFSVISHDLRNPLTALISGNKMLVQRIDRFDKDGIKSVAEGMLGAATTLLNLLDGLLDWAKLQRGQMRYKPRKIDIFYIVEENFQLFTNVANQKEVELENDLERETFIYGDYQMIYTTVRNLVNNAIKFTEAGGRVTISAAEKGEFVEVSVSDTGVGMSPEKVARLFQLGERDISTEGTAGETGTGLGLLLCKEFVEKNGGAIWAESQEGVGSTITFSLPKDDDASEV